MISAVAVLALLLAAPSVPSDPPVGEWRAWLDSPGGALPFGLAIELEAGGLAAALVNGEERIAIPTVAFDGDVLLLDLPHYDSRIEAHVVDGELAGTWRRRKSRTAWTEMAFHAVLGPGPRFPEEVASAGDAASADPASAAPPARVDGRYAVRFESSADPAVAIFRAQADGTLTGTFLTTTGDYRFLAGDVRGDRLRLSCFDGAHAFLFAAQVDANGELHGDFWSRDAWHERWTARRDDAAALPDPYAQTAWSAGWSLADAVFPDVAGTPRSLADPAFAGRARIVQVFGTWCPNCNDEAPFLAELEQRYGPRGLSIVALAFELSGDFERDAEQVRRYARRHDVTYPILVAGTADKALATRAFPALDQVRSYPTTIFLHGDGRVRAVHSGYSGPATGDAHAQLRAEFEGLIEELLAEEPPLRDAAWDFVAGRRFVAADGETLAFRERVGEREVLRERLGARDDGAADLRAEPGPAQARGDVPAEPQVLPVRASSGALFFGDDVLRADVAAGVLLDPHSFERRFAPEGASLTPSVDEAVRGDEAALERALAESAGLARREALVALAHLRSARGATGNPLALAHTRDPSLGVVLAAVWSLGRNREPTAVPELVELLRDPNAAVRREAARALARIGLDAPLVRDALTALADDPDPLARAAAAEALGR